MGSLQKRQWHSSLTQSSSTHTTSTIGISTIVHNWVMLSQDVNMTVINKVLIPIVLEYCQSKILLLVLALDSVELNRFFLLDSPPTFLLDSPPTYLTQIYIISTVSLVFSDPTTVRRPTHTASRGAISSQRHLNGRRRILHWWWTCQYILLFFLSQKGIFTEYFPWILMGFFCLFSGWSIMFLTLLYTVLFDKVNSKYKQFKKAQCNILALGNNFDWHCKHRLPYEVNFCIFNLI